MTASLRLHLRHLHIAAT